MNNAVGPIFNENFAKKRFVGPMNSTQDPLKKHKMLFSKKKVETQTLDVSSVSKHILNIW